MSAPCRSLTLVEYGAVEDYPLGQLLYGDSGGATRTMSYTFGVVRTSSGVVLVDTGFSDPYHFDRLTRKYGSCTWCLPVQALSRIGVDVADVVAILLTHHHFDHAGSIDDFPDARVFVQRREVEAYRRMLELPRRFAGLLKATERRFLSSIDARLEAGTAELVDGEQVVFPGITVLPAYGTHSPGSQYVEVELDNGRWILAGDNVMVRDSLEGRGGDGVLVPVGQSTGSQTRSIMIMDEMLERVGRDSRRVVPSHDSQIWEVYASRVFGDGLHVAEIG